LSEHDTGHGDLSPENLKIYGYCITIKDKEKNIWVTEQCDEYNNLPAHYPFLGEAVSRCVHLRGIGVECRVAALLALPIDTAEEFERNKVTNE
jgi:hypothetical protein